ncbi:DUF4878 domain-containing protein [Abyssisolibacter fermentans]|uniref:DUF4878 domain-containing protein n=1 Tax=Abyssisolibacter fermentans TaxID=1766203 RepID=UPI0008343248|nr:DUF4878 domain-containing protein [Abyssisolibacter fermentans]
MKKIKLLSVLCILCLILCSCGESDSNSPKGTVNAFFECVQNGNYDKLAEYVVNAEEYGIGQVADEDEDKEKTEIIIKAMSKIKFEIKDEEINDDNAVVKVNLDIPNIGNVMLEVMQEAMVAAFSQAADDTSEKSQEEITADIEKSMIEKLQGDIETISKDLEVKLVQKDGKWLIEADNDIANAVAGNMLEAFQGMMDMQ